MGVVIGVVVLAAYCLRRPGRLLSSSQPSAVERAYLPGPAQAKKRKMATYMNLRERSGAGSQSSRPREAPGKDTHGPSKA